MAGPLALLGKGLAWLGGGSAAAKGLGVAANAVAPFIGNKGSPAKDAYGQLAGAFRAADDFGIHRLAVAGSPAGYSPAPSAAAQGIMAASQSIGRGNSKKEEALIDAQIEEARSRTVLNQANARRALSGPQPGLGGAGGPTMAALNRIEQMISGDETGSREPYRNSPAGQTVRLGDSEAYGPNPDAFEVGIGELIAGGLIYGPQWLARQIEKIPRSKPGKEPSSRSRARDEAQTRNRRAQQSEYLFPRR